MAGMSMSARASACSRKSLTESAGASAPAAAPNSRRTACRAEQSIERSTVNCGTLALLKAHGARQRPLHRAHRPRRRNSGGRAGAIALDSSPRGGTSASCTRPPGPLPAIWRRSRPRSSTRRRAAGVLRIRPPLAASRASGDCRCGGRLARRHRCRARRCGGHVCRIDPSHLFADLRVLADGHEDLVEPAADGGLNFDHRLFRLHFQERFAQVPRLRPRS